MLRNLKHATFLELHTHVRRKYHWARNNNIQPWEMKRKLVNKSYVFVSVEIKRERKTCSVDIRTIRVEGHSWSLKKKNKNRVRFRCFTHSTENEFIAKAPNYIYTFFSTPIIEYIILYIVLFALAHSFFYFPRDKRINFYFIIIIFFF